MVGVNSVIHQFGTVAIFATLFVAIQVNAERGCIFDSEHLTDFDLECNGKRSWTINEDVSTKRKTLVLEPERDGCLKIKNSVILNLTSPVVFRFYRDGAKDENEKITLSLIPKEGNCPEDECIWDITSDPQYKQHKSGEWVSAEHKFPLKSMKEFYIKLQVDKNKGKFLVDRIVLPSAYGDSNSCKGMEGGIIAAKESGKMEVNLPSQLVSTAGNSSGGGGGGEGEGESGDSPSLAEISKNLMLTSASVLTLNTLLN